LAGFFCSLVGWKFLYEERRTLGATLIGAGFTLALARMGLLWLTSFPSTWVWGICQEAAHVHAPYGSNARKIGDVYISYMDEAAIEAKGLAPIRPHLDAIAAIRDKSQLARALGESLRADVNPLNSRIFHTPNLFGLWVAPGFNDSGHYAAYLMQGGLEMPDRESYLSDTVELRDTRAKYQAHVSALLKLAGITDAELRAKRVVALEHAIAEKHESLADSQDIGKANNTWTQADFGLKAPGIDWDQFFRAAGLRQQGMFIVWQPAAFTGESALVASEDLRNWRCQSWRYHQELHRSVQRDRRKFKLASERLDSGIACVAALCGWSVRRK
jgi:putative endopeptidase